MPLCQQYLVFQQRRATNLDQRLRAAIEALAQPGPHASCQDHHLAHGCPSRLSRSAMILLIPAMHASSDDSYFGFQPSDFNLPISRLTRATSPGQPRTPPVNLTATSRSPKVSITARAITATDVKPSVPRLK